MEYVNASDTKTVAASVLGKSIVTVTRLRSPQANHGMIEEPAVEEALLLSVQLRDYAGQAWADGKLLDFNFSKAGDVNLFDYRRRWKANVISPFDSIHFHIPNEALTSLEDKFSSKVLDAFAISPGENVKDSAILGLTQALLPALENPDCASRLFLDQVSLALTLHLTNRYGKAPRRKTFVGGLTPWQLDRALQMMESSLDNDLSLAALGDACGLSPAYFARSFKVSTGMPPYRWMTNQRVIKAKTLIQATRLSLREIATICGYRDQSHFHRTFANNTGLTPGEWRRLFRT